MNFYRSLLPANFRLPIYRARKLIISSWGRAFIHLTDPSVMFMRSRLEKLRGACAGQRCFIMGNGPSLNRMDLELFKDEIVWGSNRCYLLFQRIQWRPKFYVAVDKRVVPDNAEEINSLCHILTNTLFFYPISFRYNKTLKSAKNVYWYNEIPKHTNNLPHSMFSIAPSKFVYSVNTVTIAMLQLAVYFGFNPIYLIGCDTSYIIPNSVQYEKGDPNLLISTGDDPNHFNTSYFGKDKKWHDPNVDGMIIHYEQVRKICDERSISIINATVGGNLEIFPRVNYLDLF